MAVLLSNVVVLADDGTKVTLFGGDVLPAWAEGQVSAALLVGGSVESVKAPPAEAFGVVDLDDVVDDEPATRVAFKGKK